jgi:serpin B
MTSSGGRGLFVGRVVHKAFLEVNERGTEAAAAMGAEVTLGGTRVIETVPFIPTVAADRPFLFLIRDRGSGAILFLGRLADPSVSPA